MKDLKAIELALTLREQMLTLYDKKLFIILYGDLIDTSYKIKLEKRESETEKLFNDLIAELSKAVSII